MLTIVTLDQGYSRKEHLVVDTDTGEIMLRKHECNPDVVFALGASTCISEAVISIERKSRHGNECWYAARHTGPVLKHLFYGFKSSKRKRTGRGKHSGGKPSYAKLYATAFADVAKSLDIAERGIVASMASAIDWKNGYVADKDKRSVTNTDTLAEVINCPASTLYRRLPRLKELGIVSTDAEGRFFVAKNLVSKG